MDVSGISGFGTWPTNGVNPAGIPLGSVSVNCSAGITFALGIDAGAHYNGRDRQLAGHNTFVTYVLRIAANGPEWGDTGLSTINGDYVDTHPAQAVMAEATGAVQHFFVWGDAFVAKASAGSYIDTINVTAVW
jgi:spore coat protein U-like protein